MRNGKQDSCKSFKIRSIFVTSWSDESSTTLLSSTAAFREDTPPDGEENEGDEKNALDANAKGDDLELQL